MTEAVIVAIISSVCSLVGVIITSAVSISKNKSNILKTQEEMHNNILASQEESRTNMLVAQAVTDTKIEELTREVREHNNYAQRVPKLEGKVEMILKELDINGG